MVVVYHQNNAVTKVISPQKELLVFDYTKSISQHMIFLANQFPRATIVWCHDFLANSLNLNAILSVFHHEKMMLSYGINQTFFLGDKIGYVEESPFIKVNKKVSYPTWLMSSDVGVIHASVLNLIGTKIKPDADFGYFLNSIAKVGMPLGLLCYSEPNLLSEPPTTIPFKQCSTFVLFRFVKQHYRTRWVFLLSLNLIVYEKTLPLIPMIFSLFYKNRNNKKIDLEAIIVKSSRIVVDKGSVDVIIPTIGREDYLHDVLIDFSKQTRLPEKVIIVEQNPVEGSTSDLDYLYNEKWPFVIEHIFTHQAGACNARNLALDQTESEWIFLADDDNRFKSNLIEDIFYNIMNYGSPIVTTSYRQKNEIKLHKNVIQWPTFGAGNSFVRRDLLVNIRFNTALEFGYGEDGDFGMQLRNQGNDVLYLPVPEILHLKAPIGGFRTRPVLSWDNDKVQPKPSPTIMLYKISNNTIEQIRGYKTTLFFKYYKHHKIANPYHYFVHFRKQWNRSLFWANQLKTR